MLFIRRKFEDGIQFPKFYFLVYSNKKTFKGGRENNDLGSKAAAAATKTATNTTSSKHFLRLTNITFETVFFQCVNISLTWGF